ncbi:MAG: hypothetical protein AAFP92_29740 [Bacteroidota bacterium]
MKFSTYTLLSQLILGYVWLVFGGILWIEATSNVNIEKFAIVGAPIAIVLGYFINTFSSWIENGLFWLWRGKPSRRLIEGTANGKIIFYSHKELRKLIQQDLGKYYSDQPTSDPKELDELFGHTLSFVSSGPNRYEEFNASYAFSRGLIVTLIGGWIAFLIGQTLDVCPIGAWYHLFWILILVAFFRTKERAYYLAREAIANYYRIKSGG